MTYGYLFSENVYSCFVKEHFENATSQLVEKRGREARTKTPLRRRNRERGARALTHQKRELIFGPSEHALISAVADTAFIETNIWLMIARGTDILSFIFIYWIHMNNLGLYI